MDNQILSSMRMIQENYSSKKIIENYNTCGCVNSNKNCQVAPGAYTTYKHIIKPGVELGTKQNGAPCLYSPECSSGFCKVYGSPAQNGWDPRFQLGFCETLE